MNSPNPPPGPLSGVRILDLSRILAGPWSTQMLADMGADVIKVEKPGEGDESRRFSPFMKDADGRDTAESSFYLCANRNKRSITVDLASASGQQVIRALAMKSDVLVENFKVGDLQRYGLDYASLAPLNDRLIYCSITGFGQTGPYRARPGYDAVFQAMGGLMSVTGFPEDQPGGAPMKTGPSLADILAGQYGAYAILGALYHRDVNGGRGQHIDIALMESLIASMSHYASHYLVSGSPPVRRGTEGNGAMPTRSFRCADGDVMVVANNNEQFRRLCETLGNPEVAKNPLFATNAMRTSHRRELADALEPLFAKLTVQHVLDALERAVVPAGPINDLRQVFDDPHVQERGMKRRVAHPLAADGGVDIVRNPVRFSGTPIESYRTPPLLGEHTRSVLAEVLSMSEAEIDALMTEAVKT